MDKNIYIEAKSIGKSYGDKRVIHDVSIKIHKGEIVALLGPNGAGKTTSFYMISGIVYPDEGHIYISGEEITYHPMHIRANLGMGYLSQESSIFKDLTVEENIMAALEIVEKSVEKRQKRLDELLEDFSITRLRKSKSVALSGGEKRRLEIARSLATNPDFILLDEPLAGVDPVSVHEIGDIINKLKNKGLGVLITDHNVREAFRIVDRAYILSGGGIIKEGSPDEIMQDELVREVYLGKDFYYK